MDFATARKLKEFEAAQALFEARLTALERERECRPQPRSVLSAQAAAMHEQGAALKAEVCAILEAHAGPKDPSAKVVLAMVKRTPKPSLRRVQEVMSEIKRDADGSAFSVLARTESHN